jgi:hypothetical protein
MEFIGNTLRPQLYNPSKGFIDHCRFRILTIGYQWIVLKSRIKKRISIYRTQLMFFYF